MQNLEDFKDLYEKGKIATSFTMLVKQFTQQRIDPDMESYCLMFKLLQDKPQFNMPLIKKARRFFSKKYCLEEMLQAHRSNEKINKKAMDLVDLEIFVEMSITLARWMLESNQIDELRLVLEELQAILQIFDKDSILWMVQGIQSMLSESIKKREKSQVPSGQQVTEYNSLVEEQNQLSYFKQEGMFAYLIPTRWLRKWKSYVQYPTSGDEEIVEESTVFNEVEVEELDLFRELLGIETSAIDEELDADTQYPGPVDGSLLLEVRWDLIIDTFSPKSHQNYIVRSDTVENRDFLFVGHKVFRFFKSLYGGFEVKRMIVNHLQTNNTYVDIQAKVISFMTVPNLRFQNTYKIQYVVIGSKENFEALNKKIARIFGRKLQLDKFPQTRWLKFMSCDDQNEFLDKYECKDDKLANVLIRALVLEERVPIEEMNVVDSDVLILELKLEKLWYLVLEQRQQQVSSSGVAAKTPQLIQKLMNEFNISVPAKKQPDCRLGLTGLQNLGNTCFMNSALQCMSNIYELTEYMITNKFVPDLNPSNPIGTKGYLAVTYAELMKAIWMGKYGSVSAWELKRVIGKFAPQFYGHGQQDSQELLSYVLDGLHEDLNRVISKPTVEDIKITTEADSQAAATFWNNYKKRNDSTLIDLVAGQFKSTLVCPICKGVSRAFDPFMSISLPIPNFTQLPISMYLIQSDSQLVPLKYAMHFSSELSTADILQHISRTANVPVQELDPVMIKDHRIKERVPRSHNVKWIHDHEGMLFVHQLQRKKEELQNDEAHVLLYFMQKGQKFLEFEPKTLSYVRQLVVDRSGTVGDLFVKIYAYTRPNIMSFLQGEEKVFSKDEVKWFTECTQPNGDRLREEISRFQELGRFPYVFKMQDQLGKNKSIEYYSNDSHPLSSISQYLKVELFMNEFIKPEALRLQRCKQYQSEVQEPQRDQSGDYSIQDCLRAFTQEEILGKGDEWYCGNCRDHVQATKKMEIYRAPKVFKIINQHLDPNTTSQEIQDQQDSQPWKKISSCVKFPITTFDLNEYVLSKQLNDNTNYLYDLFAVSNHYGGLGNGHYTAYAHSPIHNRWVEYNDTSVRNANTADIMSEAAYVLFYRRRDSQGCQLMI